MAWNATTLVVIPGGYGGLGSGIAALDNGDIWAFIPRTPNPSQDKYSDRNENVAFYRLTDDHLEMHSAGLQGGTESFADAGEFPNGPISEVSIQWNQVGRFATDGTLVYWLEGPGILKAFDPATLTQTSIAGANPDDPSTWSSPYTIKDSHSGHQAKLGYVSGGVTVDRANRWMYFFADSTTNDVFSRGVGAYLRRVSLDGEHAVQTFQRFPEVVDHSGIAIYEDRVIFGTRDLSLGTIYAHGGYGIASCALDGSDYRLHYIDRDSIGASKRTGLSTYQVTMAVVGDHLVLTNPAGSVFVNVRDGDADLIAFPVRDLLAMNGKTHSHSSPSFEIVMRRGSDTPLAQLSGSLTASKTPPTPYYVDGYNPKGHYQYARNFSVFGGRLHFIGCDFASPVTSPTEFQTSSIRVLEPSSAVNNIRLVFSGIALKGYSPKFGMKRSDTIEVDLK